MSKPRYPKQVRHHYLYLAKTERKKGVKPGLSTSEEKCTADEAFKARRLDWDTTYKELAPWSLVGAVYLGCIAVEKGYEIEKRFQDLLTQKLGVRPVSGSSLTEFYPGADPGGALALLGKVNEWLEAEETGENGGEDSHDIDG